MKVKKKFLNENTPCGLFEGDSGNKYIVTNHYLDEIDGTVAVAIALVHSELSPFTWHILDEEPLELGCWHGSYRVKLLNALAEEIAVGHPGVISIGDRHASLQANDLGGTCHLISLGFVGPKGLHFKDFDGWIIEPEKGGKPFFQKVHEGNFSLVLRTKLKKNGTVIMCNMIMQMLKQGTMERVLPRPDSTKYSYKLTEDRIKHLQSDRTF